MAKKILVVMTTLPTDNEQTGVSPRVLTGAATTLSREYMEFSTISRALFMLNITAMGGTGPTLVVTIEGFDETANIWRTVVAFPSQNSVVTPPEIAVDPLYYTRLRAKFVVAGTATPTFTVSLAAACMAEGRGA